MKLRREWTRKMRHLFFLLVKRAMEAAVTQPRTRLYVRTLGMSLLAKTKEAVLSVKTQVHAPIQAIVMEQTMRHHVQVEQEGLEGQVELAELADAPADLLVFLVWTSNLIMGDIPSPITKKNKKMELSWYNSYIEISKKSVLLYNAHKNKFALCKKELANMLLDDLRQLKQSFPDFYLLLIQNGFLIDDANCEANEIAQIGYEQCASKETYQIIINPTLNCNFRCWYCYENHSSYSKMGTETLARVNKFVKNISEQSEIKSIHLSFFGGEPLLCYNDIIRPILDNSKLLERKIISSIQFTTNGFLISDYMIEHLKSLHYDVSFQITLDGDKEHHDRIRFSASGGSYNRIVRNIKKLLSAGFHVTIRINFTKKNLLSLLKIKDDFISISEEEKRLMQIDFQKIWQEEHLDNDDVVLRDTICKFKSAFYNISDSYNRMNSLISPCYGDCLNECVINYNGDIYKCTARDFLPEKRLGYLEEDGHIRWNNPKIAEERVLFRLHKDICKKCRIYPLCGGGCAQTSYEAGATACVACKSEKEKDGIVLSRFHDYIVIKK